MGRRSAERDAEFTHFVRDRSPRLRLIARATCGNQALADDLVQEAFERVYLVWHKLDSPDPFAYTRRIMLNLNIDRLRRKSFYEQPLDDYEFSAGGMPQSDHVVSQAWVKDLLADLTTRERSIIVLRYFEHLTERDTAAELGIALGTVKSACARALDKLRSHPQLRSDFQLQSISSTGALS